MSAERLKEIREKHVKYNDHGPYDLENETTPHCRTCDINWPCDAWILADAYDALLREKQADEVQSACRWCGAHHLNVSVCSKCAFTKKQAPHYTATLEAQLAAAEAHLERMRAALSKCSQWYQARSKWRQHFQVDCDLCRAYYSDIEGLCEEGAKLMRELTTALTEMEQALTGQEGA